MVWVALEMVLMLPEMVQDIVGMMPMGQRMVAVDLGMFLGILEVSLAVLGMFLVVLAVVLTSWERSGWFWQWFSGSRECSWASWVWFWFSW